MQLPSMFQGVSFVRLLQGAAVGAICSMVIGFNWGGWILETTAAKANEINANEAVVTVLAPICAANFQNDADLAGNTVKFENISNYKQGGFIEQGGWAVFPGIDEVNRDVARACAIIIRG